MAGYTTLYWPCFPGRGVVNLIIAARQQAGNEESLDGFNHGVLESAKQTNGQASIYFKWWSTKTACCFRLTFYWNPKTERVAWKTNWGKIKEPGSQVTPTFYRASISNADLKIIILAKWVLTNSVREIDKRQMILGVAKKCKKIKRARGYIYSRKWFERWK